VAEITLRKISKPILKLIGFDLTALDKSKTAHAFHLGKYQEKEKISNFDD